MTSEDIRIFLEHYVEAWRREDVSALVHCYAVDAEIVSPMFHEIKGREQIETSFRNVFKAFTKWEFHVHDLIIETSPEERAALFFTSEVTHCGEIFGVPGSGRRIQNGAAFVAHFEAGRIAFERRVYDFTGLLVQLGVLRTKFV